MPSNDPLKLAAELRRFATPDFVADTLGELLKDAADVIEALVKERDALLKTKEERRHD